MHCETCAGKTSKEKNQTTKVFKTFVVLRNKIVFACGDNAGYRSRNKFGKLYGLFNNFGVNVSDISLITQKLL